LFFVYLLNQIFTFHFSIQRRFSQIPDAGANISAAKVLNLIERIKCIKNQAFCRSKRFDNESLRKNPLKTGVIKFAGIFAE